VKIEKFNGLVFGFEKM